MAEIVGHASLLHPTGTRKMQRMTVVVDHDRLLDRAVRGDLRA